MILAPRVAGIAAAICFASALALGSPGMAFEKEGAAIVAHALGTAADASLTTDLATDVAIEPSLPAVTFTAIASPTAVDTATASIAFASLGAAVAAQAIPGALDRELECLAGATYFESKGEPLEGQLAVAEVILNRATSGRFPGSVCGVVHQRGQFSFVRGGKMPAINRTGRAWREAVAVAQIAQDELWESSASDALFFHARRVSPGWRLKRVGTVGNHVFYR